MKFSYTLIAVTKPEYMRPPSEHSRPVLISVGDKERYERLGWMVIGDAAVSVDYLSQEEIQAQQLGALNRQLLVVRAENQQRENAILDQISKLQALTYESA